MAKATGGSGGRGGRVVLVSLRQVGAGEELLLDDRITGNLRAVPCHGGASACRTYMNLELLDPA